MARTNRWQFAIDVGGTFTDCVAHAPDGRQRRLKLLSSSEMPGAVQPQSDIHCIVDDALATDPAGFWTDYRMQLRDRSGAILANTEVARHEAGGRLYLRQPLRQRPRSTDTYALTSDEDSPIMAIRRCIGAPLSHALPAVQLRLGTTLGTNALLTFSGAATGLVVTQGFADLLTIGYQDRPRLFELNIQKSPPVYRNVVEIDERLAATGEVLKAASPLEIRQQLVKLQRAGIASLAICLLHAYIQPVHEHMVASIARELGFSSVHASHEVLPLLGMIRRAETTVTDAYLGPVLLGYVDRLRSRLHPDSQVRLLTSAGGLVQPEHFSGKDSLLSGPAGGVVGYARAAEAAGYTRVIGLDMGGTSTDVSRYAGKFETVYETNKNGIRVSGPSLAIETVAAGGGSICRFDGVKLVVGPESAAADPGPACYGRGGPLTITDMNLALGRLLPARFPLPLQTETVQRLLAELAERVHTATGRATSPWQLAEGFLRIANTQMAEAIRTISIGQGEDPRDYVLSAFGGAAPQHACELARQLSMASVLVHPDGGILSAIGIAAAEIVRHATAPVYQPLNQLSQETACATGARLGCQLQSAVIDDGADAVDIDLEIKIELRYTGQEAALRIAANEQNWRTGFEAAHHHMFGYINADREIEVVAVRASAVGHVSTDATQRRTAAAPSAGSESSPLGRKSRHMTNAYFAGRRQEVPVVDHQDVSPHEPLDGPAIIIVPHSTIVVDRGWQATMLEDGQFFMTQTNGTLDGQRPARQTAEVDPVALEVFNCRFAAIARQMGVTLQKTASSVNVKERLDFSCAIFTPTGELVVNAPHMPVHLGSMSETVRHVISDHPDLRPGDVVVTNNPYRGGSHLPDVTVVTPVFANDDSGDTPTNAGQCPAAELLFFTASRAHHAEIGGTRPGSMPPDSQNLAEEGVLIRSMKILDAGRPQFDALRETLSAGSYPSRAVDDNLADIRAQIASNQQGVRDLLTLGHQFGTQVVQAYMRHIQAAAAKKMRQALSAIPNGRYGFEDQMDDGSPIRVVITIAGDQAAVDFTGSADTHPGNLNANLAIVRAAVIYCFRCLIQEDIPLNEGVLQPITILVPPGMLNPREALTASQCAAVVGGNVETSQRLVDVILAALGLAAASQGTMNNFLFGDATFGYYETICGGAGATPQGAGADAVQTHMTNTRLTDPEVLEYRFPVRLHRFAIRHDSGGRGLHSGGQGVVREIEFLQPLEASLLTQRRDSRPFGLAGGQSGSAGSNRLRRADGTAVDLPGIASVHVAVGDRLIICTPGGGGWKQGDEA